MRNAAQLLHASPFSHARSALASPGFGDGLVGAVFAAAGGLASPIATFDSILRPERTARVRAALHRAHAGRTNGTAELRAIWFARIAREGLRLLLALGFADAVLRRIEVIGNVSAPGRNCVYAIYHTPWGRVLALWMARQSDGIVFSARRWMDRAGKAHVPCTWRGLRELVRRIEDGSSAAVTADHFAAAGDHSIAASMLGREVRVSTGAARIAAAGCVPIVPVITRYRAGKLEVIVGTAIDVKQCGVADATRRVTAIFDAELRRDPSGWEQAHRFLSARVLSSWSGARSPACRGWARPMLGADVPRDQQHALFAPLWR